MQQKLVALLPQTWQELLLRFKSSSTARSTELGVLQFPADLVLPAFEMYKSCQLLLLLKVAAPSSTNGMHIPSTIQLD